MIELTVQEMIDSIPTLKELAGRQLKSKVAYNVARLLKTVQSESETFENARMALINLYGEKDENNKLKTDENGNIFIKQDQIKDFNEELSDLLNNVITIHGDKINLNDLEDQNFTPQQMLSFEKFIEE